MLKTQVLYELQDITICPAVVSDIDSRSECNTDVEDLTGKSSNFLPLVASPMSSVVSLENYSTLQDNGVSAIIPRNIPIEDRLRLCTSVFCAFSLSEIKENLLDVTLSSTSTIHILIDIANGHMKKQLEYGKALRVKYGEDNLKLMGGNIANPNTALQYIQSGFDYIRLGIAGGSRCLTGTQTGIYYPMASLISETVELIKTVENTDRSLDYRRASWRNIKLIADGGIGSYSDIIKCLALGADYVMLGRLLAQTFEGGASPIINPFNGELSYPKDWEWDPRRAGILERDYYGMSTKKAQIEISGEATKTSEGKLGRVKILSDLPGWIDNMKSYLRSSMSYTRSHNLDDFKKNAVCYVISGTASHGINSK